MSLWESSPFWLSIAIIIGGGMAIWGLYKFGRSLTTRELDFWLKRYLRLYVHYNLNQRDRDQLFQECADAYRSYLQERNNFWEKYGQVLVAIVIVVVLAVLLLTKTITPEAGLPILSGVGGFAIAKSTNLSNQNRLRSAPGPREG